MIVIVHDRNKTETLHNVVNLSVSSEGFCCELSRKADVVDVVRRLKQKGFDVGLNDRLITLPLTGFSAFDDV
jgi:hypothetical protein